MDELSIPADIMRDLIVRMRNFMAREDVQAVSRHRGESEDESYAVSLQSRRGDPEKRELVEEIDGLHSDQKAELVALMWVGRGDYDADDWEEAKALAVERHAGPTADYLMMHPLVAEHWCDGLDILFDGSDLLATGEY